MSDKCEYLYIGGMRVPMENVLVTYVPSYLSQTLRTTQSFRIAAKSPGKDRGTPPVFYATTGELKKLLKTNEHSTMVAHIYDPKTGLIIGEPFDFNPTKARGRAGRKRAAKENRSSVWSQFEDNEFVANLLAKGVSYGASKGLDVINTGQLVWLARTQAGITVLHNILETNDPSLEDVRYTLAGAFAAAGPRLAIGPIPFSPKVTEAFANLAPLAAVLGFGAEAKDDAGRDLDYVALNDSEWYVREAATIQYRKDALQAITEAACLNGEQPRTDKNLKLWERTPEVLQGLGMLIDQGGGKGPDKTAIEDWITSTPDPRDRIAALRRLSELYGLGEHQQYDMYPVSTLLSIIAACDPDSSVCDAAKTADIEAHGRKNKAIYLRGEIANNRADKYGEDAAHAESTAFALSTETWDKIHTAAKLEKSPLTPLTRILCDVDAYEAYLSLGKDEYPMEHATVFMAFNKAEISALEKVRDVCVTLFRHLDRQHKVDLCGSYALLGARDSYKPISGSAPEWESQRATRFRHEQELRSATTSRSKFWNDIAMEVHQTRIATEP